MIHASRVLAKKRVLIVEDELLVALMIEDLLADLGCEVVGPFGSVAQALSAAGSEPIDLAVLDVNLGGEMVYPVAERLGYGILTFVSAFMLAAIMNPTTIVSSCTHPALMVFGPGGL